MARLGPFTTHHGPFRITGRPVTGSWSVDVTHHRRIRPISTDGPRLNIAWVELVQVIQRRDGSIPLIAGKPTALRIFINSDLPDGSPMTASVEDILGEVRIGADVIPFSGARALSAGTHQRGKADHAVAVKLPPLSGSVKIEIRAAVAGHSFDEPRLSAAFSHTAEFIEVQKLTLRPVLLAHPGQATPSMAQFNRVLDHSIDLGGSPGWYSMLGTAQRAHHSLAAQLGRDRRDPGRHRQLAAPRHRRHGLHLPTPGLHLPSGRSRHEA